MSEAPTGSMPLQVKPIERPDPILRADSMAYVRFRRRDVDEMERFLRDFGMTRVDYPGEVRFYRGCGSAAYLVSVEPGEDDAFLGFGASVRDAADLLLIGKETGAAVETVTAPGSGSRVRLVDPDGLEVDLVHGQVPVDPLEAPAVLGPVNTPARKNRVNAVVRPPLAPSPIFKLGHIVIQRPNFDRAAQWYMRHLGVIPSDVQVLEDGSPALSFFRLDCGEQPADHHSIAILGGPATGLMHVSFETFDIDAVGQGHQYLKARGWTPYWGIGRHNLGSQFFDYWKDPVGDEWEHYADGDVMDASYPTGYHPLGRGTLWTWGDDLPDSMRPDVPLEALADIHAAGGFGDMPLERVEKLMRALQLQPRPWMR
jgi:catechol 2,3-dioxygenase-like lactoylglutathione lyase family enzyme